MAPDFNTYHNTNARLVSSWLHKIPSDAGGGSEATLIAPSVYEQSSPRRRKDQPPNTKGQTSHQSPIWNSNQPFSLKQPPFESSSPTRSPTRRQTQLSPANSTPLLAPNPPNNNNNNSNNSPRTYHSSPQALRALILQNFTTHCPLCNPSLPIPPPTTPSSPSSCPRCTVAQAYTNRTHHSPSFLSSHLLPISEVLSFDEMVAYLNQAIISRLAKVLERNGRGDKERGVGRTWPTLDDFDFVRDVARVRREVFGGFGEGGGGGLGGGRELGVDRFGMVRDREKEREG